MRIRPVILIIIAWCACVVHADDRVLIASSINDDSSRAWAVYENSSQENLLVYFAPRDDASAQPESPIGQIQAVRKIGSRLPLDIAALNDRVYLTFTPVYADRKRIMRVYSIRAIPSPIGSIWSLDPPDQMQVEHPLITDASLLGFHATSKALWALLEQDDTHELRTLTPAGWESVPVPSEYTSRRLELHAIGTDPVLVDRSGLTFKAHRYDPDAGTWSTLPTTLELGTQTRVLSSPNALHVIDENESGQSRLRYWSEDGIYLIADAMDLPAGAALTELPSSHTILGMHLTREPSGEGEDDPDTVSIRMLELDAKTGSVRFDDAPAVTAPVSVEEFRFLVVMMILVMSGVLVVVILPDHANRMYLPEGMQIADPGRRLIASVIDVFLVTSIVGYTVGVAPSQILTLSIILQPGNAWTIFPMTIVAGIAYSTSAEFIVSATPGKILMGLRVVAAEEGTPRRPRLWSALVRNVIKWVLPPVAALALIDPETLHRGDRTSRSLVVMPRREEDPETH